MGAKFILNEYQILSKLKSKSPKCKNIPKRHCALQVHHVQVPPRQTDDWSRTFTRPKRPH